MAMTLECLEALRNPIRAEYAAAKLPTVRQCQQWGAAAMRHSMPPGSRCITTSPMPSYRLQVSWSPPAPKVDFVTLYSFWLASFEGMHVCRPWENMVLNFFGMLKPKYCTWLKRISHAGKCGYCLIAVGSLLTYISIQRKTNIVASVFLHLNQGLALLWFNHSLCISSSSSAQHLNSFYVSRRHFIDNRCLWNAAKQDIPLISRQNYTP